LNDFEGVSLLDMQSCAFSWTSDWEIWRNDDWDVLSDVFWVLLTHSLWRRSDMRTSLF